MSTKTFRGRTRLLGPAFTQELPIQIDPTINEGALVYGEDGIHWFSDGRQWRSMADLVPDIRTPEILEPTEAQIVGDPTVTIVGNEIVTLYPADLPITQRRFQIQEAGGDWSMPVVDQIADSTQYTVPSPLSFVTNYEVRIQDVRMTDGKASYWSTVVAFSTANNILTPVNQLPADGAIDIGGDSQLIASVFGTATTAETHVASQFKIWRGELLVDDSGVIPPQRYYTPVSTAINESNYVYTWQVRYQGAESGWSEWSALTSFTDVRVRVLKPENVLPSNGSNNVENDSVTLQSTIFNTIGATDSHFATEWEILRNGSVIYTSGVSGTDLTSHIVPVGKLEGQKQYTWRVRHRGTALGWSDWSDPTSFTPYETYIERPEGTSPTASALVASNDTVLQSTVFSVLYGSDTHVASQWRIYNDLTDQLMHDSGEFTTTLTQYTAPAGFQVQGDIYRWEVRYKGANLGWTEWSVPKRWTTAYRIIAKPENTFPPAGDDDVDIAAITLAASGFEVRFGDDTHQATQWQVRRDSDDLIAFDSGADDTNLTNSPVPDTNLEAGVLYKWRVRYKGFVTDWSDWSDYTTFSAIDYVVQKPVPLIPTDGSTDVATVLTLVADAFVSADATDAHVESEFRVINVLTGITTTQFLKSTGTLTEADLPVELEYNSTGYYWQVRYRGSVLGWSEWSDPVNFTTPENPVYYIAPSANHPEDDTETGTTILDLFSMTLVPNTLGRVGANYNWLPTVDGWVYWIGNDGIRRREEWGVVEELVYAFSTPLTTTFNESYRGDTLATPDLPVIYFAIRKNNTSIARVVKFNTLTLTMEFDTEVATYADQKPFGGCVAGGVLYFVASDGRNDNLCSICAISSAGLEYTKRFVGYASKMVNVNGEPWMVASDAFTRFGIVNGDVDILESIDSGDNYLKWMRYDAERGLLLGASNSSIVELDLATKTVSTPVPMEGASFGIRFSNLILVFDDWGSTSMNTDHIYFYNLDTRESGDYFDNGFGGDSFINGLIGSDLCKTYNSALPAGV